MLSRLVIAFLPRSKRLSISWLQSPSTVILKPKKIKSVSVSIISPSAMKWWDWIPWPSFFECCILSQLFHSPLLLSSRSSSVPLYFLPLGWCHLHIWAHSYFSLQSWFQLEFHPTQYFVWRTLHISLISRVTIYSLTYSFPNLEPVCCSTSDSVASWPVCRFLRRQGMQSSIPKILLKNFPVCCDLHKGFSVVNEAEVDVFQEFSTLLLPQCF